MKKLLLLIVVLTAIVVSCDNNIEESYLQGGQTAMLKENGNNGKTQDSPLLVRKNGLTNVISNETIVEDETITVYGCDRTVSKKKAKLALNAAAASKFGLTQGIYVVEYLLCYKNVARSGYDIWSERSDKCGYKPSMDFALGNTSITTTKERGYEEPQSDAKELKTFVLHAISDVYGRKVDKYDPCTPKDIEWIYTISPQ